jgi:phosphatidylserine decarboxylase
MLRQIILPIHPDGWKFAAIGIATTLILFLVWHPLGWLALILTLWIVYFFRDPWRVTPRRDGLIVSPADGTVVSVAPAPPPPELDMGSEPATRIGIFLNLFDVHVARAPFAGALAARHYTPGRFINASLDKASEHNERLALRFSPPEGPDVACILIAGLVARRIVCNLIAGQRVGAGERIGIIRFGSRVDVYVPPPYVPLVVVGQRMVGGETVLADCEVKEPPREGFSH